MTDEDSPSVAMKDVTSTSFGYIIGFLLPGLLGMYGLGYWSAGVHTLLTPALNAEANVGPSLILLLGALGAGLCISAVRWLVFEKFLCKKSLPRDLFLRLNTAEKLASFRAVVDEHYRYHQFYGGSFLALIILYTGLLHQNDLGLSVRSILAFAGFMGMELLLMVSAADAFNKYVDRGTLVVSGPHEARATHA